MNKKQSRLARHSPCKPFLKNSILLTFSKRVGQTHSLKIDKSKKKLKRVITGTPKREHSLLEGTTQPYQAAVLIERRQQQKLVVSGIVSDPVILDDEDCLNRIQRGGQCRVGCQGMD